MGTKQELFVTHYHSPGLTPFLSLSELGDDEAVALMRGLCEDSPYGERFKDPLAYLRNRRATEAWVRGEFVKKGRAPKALHPLYAVLGRSRWLDTHGPLGVEAATIRMELEGFGLDDISFTYPDSMISLWFSRDRPEAYYLEEFHGKVFDKDEIAAIVEERGFPEESWEKLLPDGLAPYIEAQIWDHDLARALARG